MTTPNNIGMCLLASQLQNSHFRTNPALSSPQAQTSLTSTPSLKCSHRCAEVEKSATQNSAEDEKAVAGANEGGKRASVVANVCMSALAVAMPSNSPRMPSHFTDFGDNPQTRPILVPLQHLKSMRAIRQLDREPLLAVSMATRCADSTHGPPNPVLRGRAKRAPSCSKRTTRLPCKTCCCSRNHFSKSIGRSLIKFALLREKAVETQ